MTAFLTEEFSRFRSREERARPEFRTPVILPDPGPIGIVKDIFIAEPEERPAEEPVMGCATFPGGRPNEGACRGEVTQ